MKKPKPIESPIKSKNRLKANENKKRFKCDICSQELSDLSKLESHRRIHTGVKQFECEICGKAFNKLNSLNQHRRVHQNVDKRHSLKSKSSGKPLNRRINRGEKQFKCDICNIAFYQLSLLKLHFCVRDKLN